MPEPRWRAAASRAPSPQPLSRFITAFIWVGVAGLVICHVLRQGLGDYYEFMGLEEGAKRSFCIYDAAGGDGIVHVRGWSLGKSKAGSSTDVHVYIGGPAGQGEKHVITANVSRPDVNKVYGVLGNHGFDVTIKTEKRGSVKVYAYGINIGAGSNSHLTSSPKTVTVSAPKADTRKSNSLAVSAVKSVRTAAYGRASTIKASKAFKVTKNASKAKVSFEKKSGNSKIRVGCNGEIYIAKGLKKGTYKVKVNATSAATSSYKPATKSVRIKIKVR